MEAVTNRKSPLGNADCSNGTFFHEPQTFITFEQNVLNNLIAKNSTARSFKILNFGCGKGQETYTIAITMYRKSQMIKDLKYEIIGLDPNAQSVDRARLGSYDENYFQSDIAKRAQESYFKCIEDEWRLLPQIKAPVQFMNLDVYDNLASLGQVDVIFARYLLKYFPSKSRQTILEKLTEVLAENGYLIIGQRESLIGLSADYLPYDKLHGIYQRTPNS